MAIWDGWRGLAIALVLVGHFYDIQGIHEDRFGVDLFFALSGMLMAILLFEKGTPLRTFYLRRASRILPAFVVFIVSIHAAAWLIGIEFTLGEFVSSLVFLRTYLPLSPGIFDTEVPIGHIWSLNVEEHAYVAMSLLTLPLLTIRRVAGVLGVLALLSVVVSLVLHGLADEETPHHSIGTVSTVCFVFFSAAYRLIQSSRQIRLPVWASPLLLALAALCYMDFVPNWCQLSIPPLLLSVSVNHLADVKGLLRLAMTSRALRMLGVYSFSIYLWQQPFYAYTWAVPGGSAVSLLLALVAGGFSHRLIERPSRAWINDRWAPHSVTGELAR